MTRHRWMLWLLLLLPFGSGCITARVLLFPRDKFRPGENAGDALIGAAALAADDREERRDNTLRGEGEGPPRISRRTAPPRAWRESPVRVCPGPPV
ncbi:MAG: hypothetical protein ACYTHM_16875 [Planctomycetota bacterium]